MGEHCSDHTLPAVTTVYAKAIFAVEDTQLPLEALYNHRDYIDLLSAQEFGMEALFPARTLQCVAIATRPDALDEMEDLITGRRTQSKVIASAQAKGECISVSIKGCEYSVPNEEDAENFCRALQEVPNAARLAVLAAWCTGYRVVLYGTEELL